jgi:hypothetical protein
MMEAAAAACAKPATGYTHARREPEKTAICRVMQNHLLTFEQEWTAKSDGRTLSVARSRCGLSPSSTRTKQSRTFCPFGASQMKAHRHLAVVGPAQGARSGRPMPVVICSRNMPSSRSSFFNGSGVGPSVRVFHAITLPVSVRNRFEGMDIGEEPSTFTSPFPIEN